MFRVLGIYNFDPLLNVRNSNKWQEIMKIFMHRYDEGTWLLNMFILYQYEQKIYWIFVCPFFQIWHGWFDHQYQWNDDYRSVNFEMSFWCHRFDQNGNKNIVRISALKVFIASLGLLGSFFGLPVGFFIYNITYQVPRNPKKLPGSPQEATKNFRAEIQK